MSWLYLLLAAYQKWRWPIWIKDWRNLENRKSGIAVADFLL